MKLQVKSEPQNIEYRMSNVECRRVGSLRSVFYKMTVRHKSSRQAEYIIRCWTFDVRRSLVSLSIKLAAVIARGGAYMKLHIVGTANRLRLNG
jgi:hypothetical protein